MERWTWEDMNCHDAGTYDVKMIANRIHRDMVGLCLLCQGLDHAMPNCRRYDLRKGICCMTCGLPQRLFGEQIHGNVLTGECEPGLRDLMKGVCWRIFRKPALKEKYLLGMEGDIESEEDYKRWILRLD